jgi:hypothetical protein
VPVPVVAGQTRSVEAEDEAGLAQPDLGDQSLEALTAVAGGARPSQILVDHQHPISRPAKSDGALGQMILQLGAFLVLAHLTGSGLADVDVGQLGAVRRRDPLLTGERRVQHCRSPV